MQLNIEGNTCGFVSDGYNCRNYATEVVPPVIVERATSHWNRCTKVVAGLLTNLACQGHAQMAHEAAEWERSRTQAAA